MFCFVRECAKSNWCESVKFYAARVRQGIAKLRVLVTACQVPSYSGLRRFELTVTARDKRLSLACPSAEFVTLNLEWESLEDQSPPDDSAT